MALGQSRPRGFWKRPIPELAQDWSGTRKAGRYIFIIRDGKMQSLHRLIWEHYHGPVPEGAVVDHINGNPLDNRLENLRCVSQRDNNRNMRRPHTNTSGAAGVTREGKRAGYSYWVAQWNDAAGRNRRKHFRIERLGDEEAKRQATGYRAARIADIGGYTERHGT